MTDHSVFIVGEVERKTPGNVIFDSSADLTVLRLVLILDVLADVEDLEVLFGLMLGDRVRRLVDNIVEKFLAGQ